MHPSNRLQSGGGVGQLLPTSRQKRRFFAKNDLSGLDVSKSEEKLISQEVNTQGMFQVTHLRTWNT